MSTVELPIPEAGKLPQPVRSLVVRYGYLRNVGEFSYDGPRPMCGAKVVLKSKRGTELARVLTTTCENTGCAQSVSRPQMLDYIALSGGRDYPFGGEGRILRIAHAEDLSQQQHLDQQKPMYVSACKTLVLEMQLPMKLVDVEVLLGGETVTFYFLSEQRVDFRVLVKELASQFHTRIQMHQVGSRDEARLVADFETCGQECCCRQFLKVLKPISMGSAKMQKATLDPGKISGRCGRLKCCLRYEEETYEELRKKLPRNNTRVLTAEGMGTVIETTIITQLVKVLLDSERVIAVANEELLERDVKDGGPAARTGPAERPRPEPAPAPAQETPPQPSEDEGTAQERRRRKRRGGGQQPRQPQERSAAPAAEVTSPARPIVNRPAQAAPPPQAPQPPKPNSPQPPAVGIGALGRGRRGRSRNRGASEPPQQ